MTPTELKKWTTIAKQWADSGMTAAQWASEHGYSKRTLMRMIAQARNAGADIPMLLKPPSKPKPKPRPSLKQRAKNTQAATVMRAREQVEYSRDYATLYTVSALDGLCDVRAAEIRQRPGAAMRCDGAPSMGNRTTLPIARSLTLHAAVKADPIRPPKTDRRGRDHALLQPPVLNGAPFTVHDAHDADVAGGLFDDGVTAGDCEQGSNDDQITHDSPWFGFTGWTMAAPIHSPPADPSIAQPHPAELGSSDPAHQSALATAPHRH